MVSAPVTHISFFETMAHLEFAIAFISYPDSSLNLILNLQEDGAMLYV
jgi:hypothetical protein